MENRKSIACLLIVLSMAFFQSCKKSSGSGGPPPEFYLTATVDGTSWTANLKNGVNDVAAGTSGGLFLVLGVQVKGKDSTAILLAFPVNPSLNTPKSFDPLQKSVAGYVTVSGAYSADPAVNGSGSYTITYLNDSSKTVEGSFNCLAMRTKGSGVASVNITNGKFRTRYTDHTIPQPPANLKR